jgi:hypothetical protein
MIFVDDGGQQLVGFAFAKNFVKIYLVVSQNLGNR